MGNPTLCTPELTEKIAALIEELGSPELACMSVGIHKQRHYEWVARGEDTGDEPFATYADRVKKAQAAFALDNLRVVKDGKQGWQARSWLNERILPDLFSLRQKVEHSGNVTTTGPTLSPTELRERREKNREVRPH